MFISFAWEQQDKKRTKEERELVARLRIFARFHSVANHEVSLLGWRVSVYACVYICVFGVLSGDGGKSRSPFRTFLSFFSHFHILKFSSSRIFWLSLNFHIFISCLYLVLIQNA